MSEEKNKKSGNEIFKELFEEKKKLENKQLSYNKLIEVYDNLITLCLETKPPYDHRIETMKYAVQKAIIRINQSYLSDIIKELGTSPTKIILRDLEADFNTVQKKVIKEMGLKLTKKSVKNLKKENFPILDQVLDKANKLVNIEFKSKEEFLNKLKEITGEKESVEYEELLLKHAIKNEEYDPTWLSFISYRLSMYRELEKFFKEQGLRDEADQMYKKYMRDYIKKRRFIRKYNEKKFKGIKKYLKTFKRYNLEKLLEFYGWAFDFGLGLYLIFKRTVTILLGSWCIFIILRILNRGEIAYSNGEKIQGFWNYIFLSFYYSFMNISNIGTEELVPLGFFCKLFQSVEAFFGLMIFGILIAHLTRRIQS